MLAMASTFGSHFFSFCSVDYLNNASANKFSSYDEKINFRRKRNVSSSSNDDKINMNNDDDKILNESDDSHDINKNLNHLEYEKQNSNTENNYEEEKEKNEEHIRTHNEKEKNVDHHQEFQSKNSNENVQNSMKFNEDIISNSHEKSNEDSISYDHEKSDANTIPYDHEKSDANTIPYDHEKSDANTIPYNHMRLDENELPNTPTKSHERDCCSDESFDECARKKELEFNNNKKNYEIDNENANVSNNYSSPYSEKKFRLVGDFSRYMSVTIDEKKDGFNNNCTTLFVGVDLFPNVSENYLSKMFDYLTNFKDEEINKNE
ncbi:asparagine-rich antigen, putative [Plasmodium sp. DRC-Itaito]|nr:asparagine-rich antigen, putative [Plasmodium sp. DRC-Itaito]